MSQRDKAEKRVADTLGHAGDWNRPGKGPWRPGGHGDSVNTEQRKAHKAAAKEVKRARRRLDKAIVEEEQEPPFPCMLTKTETMDGTDYDCEYEYAGEITCEECQVNGGAFDPREPRHGDV